MVDNSAAAIIESANVNDEESVPFILGAEENTESANVNDEESARDVSARSPDLRRWLALFVACAVGFILGSIKSEFMPKKILPAEPSLQNSSDPDKKTLEMQPMETMNASVAESPIPEKKEQSLVLGKTSETFRTATIAISRNMDVENRSKKGEGLSSGGMCDVFRSLNRTRSGPVLLLNASRESCTKLFGGAGGTGNVITELIAERFVALAEGRTALLYDCGADAFKVSRDFVYPWFSGYFPAAESKDPLGMTLPENYCPNLKGYNKMPLRFMFPLVQHDLRRMAVALVGIPGPDHPSADFEKKFLLPEAQQPPYTPTAATGTIYRVPIHGLYENGPLFPNIEVDDVVIHFRCGDILLGAPGPFFYVKYAEYTKLISPEARSIGIVTQPFSQGEGVQVRARDRVETSGERCKTLVYGLVEHIQSHLSEAKISIHNGPNETVALAWARLVMANQTLALFPSTFSIFPAVASFGTGYFPAPARQGKPGTAGKWLNDKRAMNLYEDELVELEFTDRLSSNALKQMWESGSDEVLAWFRNSSTIP